MHIRISPLRAALWCAVLGAAARAADDPTGIQPGQAALYEGTVTLRQTLGTNEPTDEAFQVSLLLRAREDGPGRLRVTALRQARPLAGGDAPVACFDELAGPPGALLPSDEAIGEQNESSLRLKPYLGFDAWPTFTVPEAGKEVESEGEVLFLGLVPIQTPFVTRLKRAGDRRTITRELRAGAQPRFAFQEQQSTLNAYSEAYELEPGATLPARIKKTFQAVVKIEAGEVKVERTLTLAAKSIVAPGSPEAASLEAVDGELRGINADFTTFRDPGAIALRIEKFQQTAKGTLYELASAGLKARHESYKDLGLGKPAPDFTLESIDGKQVTFREATRGKVVLLSFWGVG